MTFRGDLESPIRLEAVRWCARGGWERLFQAMGEPELAEVQIDSTSIKAHPIAFTGRRLADEKKEDADERRCLGRSRGGLTTKVHAVTGRSGRLVAFQLTVRQRGDAPL